MATRRANPAGMAFQAPERISGQGTGPNGAANDHTPNATNRSPKASKSAPLGEWQHLRQIQLGGWIARHIHGIEAGKPRMSPFLGHRKILGRDLPATWTRASIHMAICGKFRCMARSVAMAWDRIRQFLFGGSEVPETRSDEGGWSIGNPDARHPYAIAPDHPAANRWFNALEFRATFQLRTPRRILERNGTVIPLTDNPPSDFEPWMGVWFPIDTGPNILAEMAPDAWARMEANRTVASDAGPVAPAEYLPFLIAFRTIVEDSSDTIAERIARVEGLFRQPELAGFVTSLQGAERVCGWFFPTVLSQIGGLPRSSQVALSERGIRTVAALQASGDSDLVAIKGIGPAKLAAIRQFCNAFEGDPHAERLAVLAV